MSIPQNHSIRTQKITGNSNSTVINKDIMKHCYEKRIVFLPAQAPIEAVEDDWYEMALAKIYPSNRN